MKLLDLFSGAGGAAVGYYRAGFTDITGVDIKPMPRYPFTFIQADALEYLAEHGQEYDVIHASPPCQGYSVMNNLPWLKGRDYPLLILPTMEMLEALGKPYVLENVMGARYGQAGLSKRGLADHGLKAGALCGFTLGLPFPRHRLFAANFLWLAPPHARHPIFTTQHGQASGWTGFKDKGGTLAIWQDGNGAQAEGVGVSHAKGWRNAAEAMGIDWMKREELTQAIPPAYTEFVGKQLMAFLMRVM